MIHCLLFNVNYTEARTAGGHRIANHLRIQNVDAEVIDFALYWSFDELTTLATQRITSNTKFVGFSHIFADDSSNVIVQFCAWLKETYPHVFLVSGGQEFPQYDTTNIDYHVMGYGEYAIDALLDYHCNNGPKPKFEIFKKGNTRIINAIKSYPAHPFIKPIIKYEDRDFIQRGEWGVIEMSRGCRFKCKFCNYPVLGVKGDSTRSAESFREELLYNYENFGIENYIVTDETCNDSIEKLTKYADIVETLPWKPYFSGFIRADLLFKHPKQREELLRMGFLGHFYGIESFNKETVKSIGKGMHPDKIKEGLIETRAYFDEHATGLYRGTVSLIAGLPYETNETLASTSEWLVANWSGQAVAPWPLEIQHNTNQLRYSELSLNYKEFGYRELSISPDVKKREDLFLGASTDDKLIWENDGMNLYDAVDWTADIKSKFNLRTNLCFSKLYADSEGNIMSLNDKIQYTGCDSFLTKNFLKFVGTYKAKKLSLSNS